MKSSDHELPIRHELELAMIAFMKKLEEAGLRGGDIDSVMQQVATEEYRRAVEKAASRGIEVSICSHTLCIPRTVRRVITPKTPK